VLKQDYFEVFGLSRRLAIDPAELQRKFYGLARAHHPDFHQAAPPDERARVEATSALVNAAYRTLRDPIARVEYLVRLEEGRETSEGAADKPKAPPALLQEMFEIQEALAEARAEAAKGKLDEATWATLTDQRESLRARLGDEEARLAGPLSARWDSAPPAERPAILASFKEALATRAYLRTVIADLTETLGGDTETLSHDTETLSRDTEGRQGSAEALRTRGGMGGDFGAPHQH
jgi:molecular chaperone HscB